MEEIYLPRTDGSRLRIVIYLPKKDLQEDVIGVCWIHGGGYAIGIPEQDFAFAEILEEAKDCVIFMPDYRLSTEAPYPAAFEDCYASLVYMKEHACEYHIRTDQIFTGGDSAGGGLCVAIDLKARDTKEVNIAFSMPLYPMLDAGSTRTNANNDAPVWNTRSNLAGWHLYLKNQIADKYASPALEEDLSFFPPTFTFVGTIEPFYAETKAFTEKLKEADVPLFFKEYEGCFHAFDILCPDSALAKDARLQMQEAFVYAGEHYFQEN